MENTRKGPCIKASTISTPIPLPAPGTPERMSSDWILSRFAVLRHFLDRSAGVPDHFDLLVFDPEREGLEFPLQCWRLPDWPLRTPRVARRIQPHRVRWLDTVADELSGNRGYVERVCGGDCHLLRCSPQAWHLRVLLDDTANSPWPDMANIKSLEVLLEKREPGGGEQSVDDWMASMRAIQSDPPG